MCTPFFFTTTLPKNIHTVLSMNVPKNINIDYDLFNMVYAKEHIKNYLKKSSIKIW